MTVYRVFPEMCSGSPQRSNPTRCIYATGSDGGFRLNGLAEKEDNMRCDLPTCSGSLSAVENQTRGLCACRAGVGGKGYPIPCFLGTALSTLPPSKGNIL